eukprot:TRINITY_DN3498_c0_g1_i3.p1 TRINITY_DN3498_c0_g1~~TRINITY_DN3498_c0_g1_i3.p1  ORF type:complete len:384 (-),score=80.79 TRINITY_DN3498_c0_g1_i3:155-1306(-)
MTIGGYEEWAKALDKTTLSERRVVIVGNWAEVFPALELLLNGSAEHEGQWTPDFYKLTNKIGCNDCCRCGRADDAPPEGHLPPIGKRESGAQSFDGMTSYAMKSPELRRRETLTKSIQSGLPIAPQQRSTVTIRAPLPKQTSLNASVDRRLDVEMRCECECLCFGSLQPTVKIATVPQLPLLEFQSIFVVIPRAVKKKGGAELTASGRSAELRRILMERKEKRVRLIEMRSFDETAANFTPQSVIFYSTQRRAALPMLRDAGGRPIAVSRTERGVQVDQEMRIITEGGEGHPHLFALGSAATFLAGVGEEEALLAPQTKKKSAILFDALLCPRKYIPPPRGEDFWGMEAPSADLQARLPSLFVDDTPVNRSRATRKRYRPILR